MMLDKGSDKGWYGLLQGFYKGFEASGLRDHVPILRSRVGNL